MAGAEERPGAQSSGGSIPRTFEPWYKDEFPRLVRALSLISGDRELAVDAASEACARALERWEQVSVMASPTGWTYTVGLNVVRRTLRRRNLERFLIRRHAVADPLLSPDWASTGLTDIHHQGHSPREDVQNGDHGEEEAASASLVHSGVQG